MDLIRLAVHAACTPKAFMECSYPGALLRCNHSAAGRGPALLKADTAKRWHRIRSTRLSAALSPSSPSPAPAPAHTTAPSPAHTSASWTPWRLCSTACADDNAACCCDCGQDGPGAAGGSSWRSCGHRDSRASGLSDPSIAQEPYTERAAHPKPPCQHGIVVRCSTAEVDQGAPSLF